MSVKLVRDLMHIGVTTCQADTLLVDAVRSLLQDDLESMIVLDGHSHAVGVLSRREAVSAFARWGADVSAIQKVTVAEVMRPDIPQVPPDISATAAIQIMLDRGLREIYLMHHGGGISWPAAVLRFQDVLRYLTAESEAGMASMGAGAPRTSPIDAFRERYSKGR